LDCAEFVDVGANDGIFTFLVSEKTSAKGLRIHWFEPDLDLYNRLTKNLENNFVQSVGNRIAIADKKGEATFFKNLSDDLSGSITQYFVEKHETRVERINTTTIGDYFEEHGIGDALVKIDVEGSGYAAWMGASRTIANIKYLVMEMLAPEIEMELPLKIISEAKLYGYYIRDFELVASFDGTFRYVAPFWNWLFCRLDPARLRSRLSGTRFRVIENGPVRHG
jgi:FkbM family methyltransferase